MSQKPSPRALGAIAASALMAALPIAASSDTDTPELKHTTVLSGLENPWGMAFLPDGAMLFTEKCRGLSVRLPDGDVNKLVGMSDTEDYATTADDLFCEGQAGMNGVAVDPDFEENRAVYVYSASKKSDPPTNRVIRLTLNEDMSQTSERTDIIEEIPYKEEASDHPFGGPGAHNGGRLRFSPDDGFLYVTTGDNHNSQLPQSGDTLGSKVLRIDRDGEAAPDNAEATPEGFDPRIFTYGHRNVQGIAFHPETGRPYITEHGPWHNDEVNALEAGANSGWDPRPNMAGREDCPDDYCGYQPNQGEGMEPEKRDNYMPMTDTDTYPEAMEPVWDNNNLSQGISSAAFLTDDKWGAWKGRLAVSFLGIGFGGTPTGQRIDLLELSDDGESVEDVTELPAPMGSSRFRALVVGPDGDLYTAVDEGSIYRITPE
ncbi:PQQ-dependent sugar dehydrogenase [Marinobacter salicampi]|uniref:PQQ-dependent sugar dehydrogenase n=1 Tax=Marinobacter salicampi TaxID=435907 RepID=UPI00140E356C|nr:PQQ-dependent sugar dehydrogenase [Marinobacter salicampi]